MKRTNLILILILVASITSCSYQPKQYASVDEYPVYEGTDLGVTYSPKKTKFRVWSPNAQAVKLNIFDEGLGGSPTVVHTMKPSKDGTWTYVVKEDLNGKFYTFQIQHNGEWLDETPSLWCKAVGVNGDRGAIIDMTKTNPTGWDKDQRPAMKSYTDAII